MVVSAMAHSTTAAAKSKERQCADAQRQPDPIAAKPIHRGVPSVAETILFGLRLGAIATGILRPSKSCSDQWRARLAGH
jgi:hypothetical protein